MKKEEVDEIRYGHHRVLEEYPIAENDQKAFLAVIEILEFIINEEGKEQ